MSEYLHRGIPNSWNRRNRVVQLTPNTWAACSHVSSALRSSSTCSMFTMSGGLPGLPVHSTCCKGMIADNVTEQVFKLESSTRWCSLAHTWICLRNSTFSSYGVLSKVHRAYSTAVKSHSSCVQRVSFNWRSFEVLVAHCWKSALILLTKSIGT